MNLTIVLQSGETEVINYVTMFTLVFDGIYIETNDNAMGSPKDTTRKLYKGARLIMGCAL